MKVHPYRRRMLIAYVALYLVFAAASARAIFEMLDDSGLWFLLVMLGVYLVSLVVEPALISRNLKFLHVINFLQVAITLTLLWTVDKLDYFSLLFIPPCIQSVLNFPRKTALLWIGATGLLMEASLFAIFPLGESVGYMIIYPAAIYLFAGLSYLALQAEQAQERSEALLADLQKANEQLKAYAAQARQLAAAEERNRLARELHDSVTQIIFGLTLSAQAARILLERDPARVAPQLDHMQALAQNALAEMRALIQQLRPRPAGGDGLPAGLRRLSAERQANDGLAVTLHITGERRLPANIEDGLFRVAQEALNNIVKHARTDCAVVTLDMQTPGHLSLCIEDSGIGFDLAQGQDTPGHLGLTSMSERVRSMGGTLEIDSKPGSGTRLRVEIAVPQEVENAR